jgi:diadenosine tetraphosphatase ApaH/serine/threonine PP2A family protein phosphatase
MLKYLLPVLLTGLFCIVPARANDIDQHVNESRKLVQEFTQSLKRELQRGLKAGGPAYAIGVCNVNAPTIAAALADESGWEVGRTSLRIRNPGNSPDDWERHILETFEERLLSGEQPADIEYFEVVQENGDPVFRYMKAIPTAEMCESCHGSNLDTSVKERLRDLYPMDQARGYHAGDIRGAFTFAKSLSTDKAGDTGD